MSRLADQIEHDKRSSFPETQVNPVHIHARVAGIAAGTAVPLPVPELGQGDHPDLVVAISRCVAGGVEPGWDGLRFEATMMGNVTTCLTYVARSGKEERSSPPFAVDDLLEGLKDALARPHRGSWISLTMVLTSTGALTVEYNYDQDTHFGLSVTASDFALELALFPRDEALIPVWWRERITHGNDRRFDHLEVHVEGLEFGSYRQQPVRLPLWGKAMFDYKMSKIRTFNSSSEAQ